MNISYAWTLAQHLDSLPSNSIKFVFLYLSRCSAVTTVALSFLMVGGELMARGMHFGKPRPGEFTAPSILCFSHIRQRFCTVHATEYQSARERAWTSLPSLCICVIKILWKLQLVGFSYDKKRTKVVVWRDKGYESISSASKKQQ